MAEPFHDQAVRMGLFRPFFIAEKPKLNRTNKPPQTARSGASHE